MRRVAFSAVILAPSLVRALVPYGSLLRFSDARQNMAMNAHPGGIDEVSSLDKVNRLYAEECTNQVAGREQLSLKMASCWLWFQSPFFTYLRVGLRSCWGVNPAKLEKRARLTVRGSSRYTRHPEETCRDVDQYTVFS